MLLFITKRIKIFMQLMAIILVKDLVKEDQLKEIMRDNITIHKLIIIDNN
jgi:hypothetical protein